MVFEYDLNKSSINKQKHGIDFEEAQLLWLDHDRVEINARTAGEPRQLLMARYNNEIWSVVFTLRNNAIRIISVRKSRTNEREIYFNTRI